MQPNKSEEIPDWVTETPELYSGYSLILEINSVHQQIVEMTRDEYIELKAHLAQMRGYAVPEEADETG